MFGKGITRGQNYHRFGGGGSRIRRYPIYVMYTSQRTNAEMPAQKLREAGFSIADSQTVNVGAAIGSHIGPVGCDVVYVAAQEE